MIPSRPLDLGGIIGEAIRIITKTYWRAAIVVLLFCAPGFIVIHFAVSELLTGTQNIVEKLTAASPDAPILMRDYIFLNNASSRTSITYLRLQYPDLFIAIDSIQSSLKTKYPDSTSRLTLRSQIDSIAKIARANNPSLISDMYPAFIILFVGIILFILGTIGSTAARYDLNSRAYEDRVFPMREIFRLSYKQNLWLLLVQYVIIGFAMLFGFGMLIGITFAISTALGAFALLASCIVIVYAVLRIIFSGIALVSEEASPFPAIKRSLDLTNGSFLRILGIVIVCGIIIAVMGIMLRIPFSIAFSGNMDWLINYIRGNSINIANMFRDIRSSMINWEIVTIISALLTASFGSAFITTFYYDLRTRKDGVLEYEEQSSNEEAAPPPEPQ